MNGGPVPQTVTGIVTHIDCSGIGPNSGEITLVIQPASGGVVEVFAGIISNPGTATGIEDGVYSSYMSMALSAMTSGRNLKVSYLVYDKPRINGMTILA